MAWLAFGSIKGLPCLALDGFLSDPVRACLQLQHALATHCKLCVGVHDITTQARGSFLYLCLCQSALGA